MRWRPPIRPLILIALLLLAGAVVNVAVAWDSAFRGLPKRGAYTSALAPDLRKFTLDDYQGLAGRWPSYLVAWAAARGTRADRHIWRKQMAGESYGPILLELGIEWSGETKAAPEQFVSAWGLLFADNATVRLDLDYGREEAHGWPFRCLWGAVLWDREAQAPRTVRAHLISDGGGWLEDARYLPLQPILPGFAINTLFYTAILALPLSVFPIRRRLRARRGRCPKCGYDRAGLTEPAAPCPECGAAA